MTGKILGRLIVVCALGLVGTAWATPLTYVLDLPPNDLIAYRIEFDVPLPGELALRADWSNRRTIAFRLEGPPGSNIVKRRTGPPPQDLQVAVDASTAGLEGPWTLVIRGLPFAQAAEGILEIRLPAPVPAVEPAPVEPTPAPVALPHWRLPSPVPDRLSPEQARLFETTEAFRSLLADTAGGVRDRYAWQEDFLRFIAAQRDLARTERTLLSVAGRKSFERVVTAIRKVEQVATSRDPVLAGPPPGDSFRHRAWIRLRNERIQPLERELDALITAMREDRPSEIGDGEWMVRFLSCVSACERHFEQRVRLGPDDAANRALIGEQWRRILAAADALESLIALEPARDGD